MTNKCTHRAIRSWCDVNGQPVDMWTCVDCGWMFEPRSDTKEASNSTEPVAWMDREGDVYPMPETEGWRPPHTLLYTHPPKRKPLKDAEIARVMQPFESVEPEHPFWVDVARAIERAHGIGSQE